MFNKVKHSCLDILYQIPRGKKNPYQPRNLGIDCRENVYQSGQKGDTCVYYVHRLIAEQIGKYPCKELHEARKIEAICSWRRKEVTKFDKDMTLIGKELFQCSDINALFTINSPLSIDHQRKLYSIVCDFQKTCTHGNLNKFVGDFILQYRTSINLNFIKQLGINLDEALQEEYHPKYGYESPPTTEEIKQWKVSEQLCLTDIFANIVQAEKLGLKRSIWTTADKIESLIAELSENGPQSGYGFIGKITHKNDPYPIGRIGDYDAFRWQLEAERVHHELERMKFLHSFLIVGAEKSKNEVFIIDPVDESPLDKPRKLYLISYDELCKNSVDLHGLSQNQIKPGFSAGYGFHGKIKFPLVKIAS